MICYVPPSSIEYYKNEIHDLFKLRKSVFVDRLGWNLKTENNLEIDEFDHCEAHYILIISNQSRKVIGGVRLTPIISPNLTMDIFSNMINSDLMPKLNPSIWESSRFFISSTNEEEKGVIRKYTCELFYGMIKYGIMNNFQMILTMTDIRVERILRMCGWELKRLGPIKEIDFTVAVVGLLDVSDKSLENVLKKTGFEHKNFTIIERKPS